jgi:hypothetical protein
MTEAVQVPKFDEYVLVLTGTMNVSVGHSDEAKRPAGRKGDEPFHITAHAGQMLHLPRGHLYCYSFPGACKYIPVCLPAFSPEISGRLE